MRREKENKRKRKENNINWCCRRSVAVGARVPELVGAHARGACTGKKKKFSKKLETVLPATFTKSGALATGLFDISMREINNNFAFVFNGQIECLKDGKYSFTISSDDGSQLFINGKMIVDNDGVHGIKAKAGSVELKKGKHDIEVKLYLFICVLTTFDIGPFGLGNSYYPIEVLDHSSN